MFQHQATPLARPPPWRQCVTAGATYGPMRYQLFVPRGSAAFALRQTPMPRATATLVTKEQSTAKRPNARNIGPAVATRFALLRPRQHHIYF
eukprot:6385210-Pyramimonas_sp.AAC.1